MPQHPGLDDGRDLYVHVLVRTAHPVYAFTRAGGHYSTFLIWTKPHFTLECSDYQRQYEPILYGWREGTNRFGCGARNQGNVWSFAKPAVNDLHPTMKPVALIEQAIQNSSRPVDSSPSSGARECTRPVMLFEYLRVLLGTVLLKLLMA